MVVAAYLVQLLADAVLAYLGFYLTPADEGTIRRWRKAIFIVLALQAIALAVQFVGNRWADEENERRIVGDSGRSPFVDVISLPGYTRFIVTNMSDYSAYAVHVDLFEATADPRRSEVRSFEYSEVTPHSGRLESKQWEPPSDQHLCRFTASIQSRAIVANEELTLRYAGNRQWMRAIRVRNNGRIIYETADTDWPRDANGGTDWFPPN